MQPLTELAVVREQPGDATLYLRLLPFQRSQMKGATTSEDESSDEGTEDQKDAEA